MMITMKGYVAIAPKSKALYVKMIIKHLEKLGIKVLIVKKLFSLGSIIKLLRLNKHILFLFLNWIEYLYTPTRLRRKPLLFALPFTFSYIIIIKLFRLLFRGRIVTVLHNVYPHESNWPLLDFSIIKFTLRNSDIIVAHSLLAKYAAIKLYNVPSDRILHFPHPRWGKVYGDNFDEQEAKRKLGFSSNSIVIGFVGNIARYKSVEKLIIAFSKLEKRDKNTYLLIAGKCNDPSYEEYLRSLIHKLKLEKNVKLENRYIPDDEMEIYIKAIDIAVIPYSRTTTPSNIMLFASYGIVTIAPDKVAVRELLKSFNNVYFFNNIEELISTLNNILKSGIYRQRVKTPSYYSDWYLLLGKIFKKLGMVN